MTLPPGYTLETIDIPDVEFEIGGLATRPNGDLLVTLRQGFVWERDADSGEWTKKSGSLHQTLGAWTEEGSDDAWVVQKHQLTRLVDDTAGPMFDLYENLCDEWGYTGDNHGFTYGLVRDSDGNFYLNKSPGNQGSYSLARDFIYDAPWAGWHIRVTPEGECEPIASGLRSPLGIGINDDDEVFYSDQQGTWVPVCHISHVVEGAFYGHPTALGGHPDFPDVDPDSYEFVEPVEKADFAPMRNPPVVWVPYNFQQSTAGVTFDAGGFGPFEGQAFFGCQDQANLGRMCMEEVNGSYQGAVFPFSDPGEFDWGIVREEFSADGSSLYVGETTRGWGPEDGWSLQRVDYDGETVPFAMHSIEITERGFRVTFTKPVDADEAGDPENYDLSHWSYNYHKAYGSDRVDERSIDSSNVTATVADGGETVDLDLSALETGPDGVDTIKSRIYEISLNGITSESGTGMAHPVGWYTVHEIPD
jgi:hypothetical protein